MKTIPVRQLRTSVKEPELTGNFSIRTLADALKGKDLGEELHRHDYFFILIVKNGTGKHTIDFTSYAISDHSFFFLRPGQVHDLSLKAGSAGYLIQFDAEFYFPNDLASRQLLRRASHRNRCLIEAAKAKKPYALLDAILEEFDGKQEGYLDVIRATLGIFFIEVVRNRQAANEASDQQTLYAQDRAEELLELLHEQVTKHKQVSHYAELLNLSAYQLNAITKSILGKTCSALIDDQLILEAKRYLLATTSQVKEISWHLGYEDASYFIRFFKKHTGLSPEQFRKNFT